MITWNGFLTQKHVSVMLETWVETYMTASPNFSHLHLFKNNVTIGPGIVLADLVEADFDGYLVVPMSPGTSWTQPKIDPLGNISMLDPGLGIFLGDTPQTTPNTIYGWYITNNADSILLMAGNMPTPLDFTVSAAALDIEIGARINDASALAGEDAEYGIEF